MCATPRVVALDREIPEQPFGVYRDVTFAVAIPSLHLWHWDGVRIRSYGNASGRLE